MRDLAAPVRSFGWYFVVLLATAVFLLPFVWMISTAFTEPGRVFQSPPQIIPQPIDFSNFTAAWSGFPFPTFYLNSFKLAILNVIGQLFACSMTAFALAKLRFRGRGLLMIVVLGTMMLPLQVTLIPQFVTFAKIGWLNTHEPLWVPSFLGGVSGAFGIFLLRQAFLGIPHEMWEAARIDGANPMDIFLRIYLPLVKPSLAVLGVFAFMNSWNDLLGPVIYLTSMEKMTVTAGLSYFQGQFSVYWSWLMAGALLAMLPTLVVYLLAQRYFVEGIARTGLK